MSTRRLGVAVAVLGGFLYAVGGSDGTSPLNTGMPFAVPHCSQSLSRSCLLSLSLQVVVEYCGGCLLSVFSFRCGFALLLFTLWACESLLPDCVGFFFFVLFLDAVFGSVSWIQYFIHLHNSCKHIFFSPYNSPSPAGKVPKVKLLQDANADRFLALPTRSWVKMLYMIDCVGSEIGERIATFLGKGNIRVTEQTGTLYFCCVETVVPLQIEQ